MGDAAKRIKDFASGYLAGVAGMPLAVVPMHDGGNTGEIVAFLYGPEKHRLPALPYWDRTVYPYACIATRNGQIGFFVADHPKNVDENGGLIYVTYNDYTFLLQEGKWQRYNTGGYNWIPIWANHPIYYADSVGGALFLEESDPEPVYAEADIDNKAIMLGCRLGYIIRSQMGKGQVEIPDGVLISSDGYILTDCDGVYLIAKEDA